MVKVGLLQTEVRGRSGLTDCRFETLSDPDFTRSQFTNNPHREVAPLSASRRMEPTERPFVHSKDSDATSWLRALLERLGAPASASAEMITAGAVSTTGALRDLHSRPAEWAEVAAQPVPCTSYEHKM